MDFITSTIGSRIQSLSQSIYQSMWDSYNRIEEPKCNFDLSHLEYDRKLDLGLVDFHYQIIEIHMGLKFTDVIRTDPNPILVYQKSVDDLKIRVIQDFLNLLVEELKTGITEDLTWETRVVRIKEYGSEQGVMLNTDDIKQIWDQVFSNTLM